MVSDPLPPDAAPAFLEDLISQIPALQVLMNLGYTYLTPVEALRLRGGRLSAVLLEPILEEQLKRINVIRFKGREFPFSEANIHTAIQALKDVQHDGLVRTNEKLYELLTLPKSLTQSIDGETKSFNLRYIDFDDPERNVFHVTDELAVERVGSYETRRPDIVLFVNGIPLAVIECKRPDEKDALSQAISQHLRNQREDGIPHLFVLSQLLLAVSKNEARYATTGTPAKFWARWHDSIDGMVGEVVNRALSAAQKDALFTPGEHRLKRSSAAAVRAHFDTLEASGRAITDQDRALVALCRPERLLELMLRYTLFDAGTRKIARYQQYFTVRSILERIRQVSSEGLRTGGVVWHTQGSGKSLTMVMLAHAIALEPGMSGAKIVLVTDRVDLDDQIYRTFKHCGAEAVRARTGRHLGELIRGTQQRIITTVIDKFEAALGRDAEPNESADIFVLVDESHRGQYGPLHAKMRRVLPNACFIGFTGTPVMRKEKNTIAKFGGLIRPVYTIGQAVEDEAVVPLLYEGRHVEQIVYSEPIDAWFGRVTENLTEQQRADLKHKYATSDQLNKARQKVERIAWDISLHFRDTWKGTPFKGQLVAQDKVTALSYKELLDEIGMVSSEVLISGPDEREGFDDVDDPSRDKVVVFWKKMMTRFGSELEYNRQLINAFTTGDEPEIIIVVDKLLTGFDAPRNTVLYLTRSLQEHALLQAIARVNRLYEGKEYGYIIDYAGVLENLDHALDLYGKLADYDDSDLVGIVADVADVVAMLPQRHADVWDVFKVLRSKYDEEAYEQLLADEEVRQTFYDRLLLFGRSLAIALSTVRFLREAPPARVDRYKKDLAFFMRLRASVRRRYAETVDFREYEPRIQKLIDTHVGTGEIEALTGLVNIFDTEAFAREVEQLTGTASKADTIAFRTKRTIHDRMDEDPAFYKRFSEMLEEAIRAFREKRISDLEYLRKAQEVSESVRNRSGDQVPPELEHRDVAKAYFGIVRRVLEQKRPGCQRGADFGVMAAVRIDEIIQGRRIVNWVNNPDVQNQMRTDIEDAIFELKEANAIELTFDEIDEIMEQCLDIARVRRAQWLPSE
jgi:type I restriction enzyme, R subunit